MARILILDDEENILSLLSTILRLGGHEVVTANNQTDGHDILRRSAIDMLLLDLRLGDLDGRDFFHRARGDGYSGAIVIVSAYGALRAARELGADGAIEKPFEPTELLAEIDRIVSLRSAETAEAGESGHENGESRPSLLQTLSGPVLRFWPRAWSTASFRI
jgi:DNA-binding response OmpR family regulator